MKDPHNTSGFIRDFIIVIVAVYLGAWAVSHYLMPHDLPLSFILSFAVFAVVTFFVRGFLVRANRKRPQIFVAAFTGSLAAKLFLSIIILTVAGLLDRPHFKFTALAYLVGYVLLSIVEIRNLLPLVRRSNG